MTSERKDTSEGLVGLSLELLLAAFKTYQTRRDETLHLMDGQFASVSEMDVTEERKAGKHMQIIQFVKMLGWKIQAMMYIIYKGFFPEKLCLEYHKYSALY